MKKNATAKALVMSVLSLMLCLSMLVGTTFAWFTDSVTSGVNKIVAGNLDVELYVKNADGSYASVDEDTSLFDPNALWEPGHTEVVSLKIKNAGTLALKYQLAVTVNRETPGTNVNGTAFNLSDYLVFGQVASASETTYATREDAWAAVGSTLGLNDYTKENEKLLPGAEEYVTLVVYMPTTVGNEANYRGTKIPTIELGITLVATQTPHEEDSFNDQYDVNAEYPKPVSTVAELKDALKEGGSIVLQDDITLTKTTITKDAVIDLNGYTLTGSATSNTNALAVNGAKLTVKNGTIVAPTLSRQTASALTVIGDADVTVENCTLQTNSVYDITVVTNGSNSVDSKIVIRNSTISAPTTNGIRSWAAYIPAGDVTFENCDVTGHIFISGGNVTLDGGTYTATGYNNQEKIFDKSATIEYAKGWTASNAYSMGDSILIADRRDPGEYYKLTGLTIRNITFNTEITLKDGSKATAYAIKYVDVQNDPAAERVNFVIENNTFNQQIDGKDPTMFIDLNGNDLA